MSSEHAVEQLPLAEQRRDRSAFVQCRESITFRLPPREAKRVHSQHQLDAWSSEVAPG
jgi:hypothetical protein